MSKKDKTVHKEVKLSKNEELLFSTVYNLSVLVDTLTVDMLPQTRENKIAKLKMSLTTDLQKVMKRMGLDGSDKRGIPRPDKTKTPKKEAKIDGIQVEEGSLREDSGETLSPKGPSDIIS